LRCHVAATLVGGIVCGCAPGVVTAAAAQDTAPSPSSQSAIRSNDFGSLFLAAADDFKRIASKDSALILTIGGVAATIGHGVDRKVSAGMSGSDWMEGTFAAGETVGGARMQAAGAIAAYAFGRATASPTVTQIGADLIRAQIVTQTLTLGIKTAVQRTRPDGTQFSFPSGHSAVMFASATVLQRNLGWKVGIPAYGVATYVAASRVQVRRHFLSDVTFGAALGIVAGRSVTVGRGDHRFALAPSVVPGGAGLSLTWVGR
jgi:hypothetical protein